MLDMTNATATIIDLATVRTAKARATEEQRIADNAQSNHWQGSRYNRDLSIVDIAKAVRSDIAAAVKSGALPAGLKVSVRKSEYSMGQSLTVTIKRCPGPIVNRRRVEWESRNPGRSFQCGPCDVQALYSDEAREVLTKVERIVAAYNYDRSDRMADYYHVNFYGFVNFANELVRADHDSAMAELADATEPEPIDPQIAWLRWMGVEV